MYKGKVGYWVTIISIVLVIQFCLSIVFPWMGSWFDTKIVTIKEQTENGITEPLPVRCGSSAPCQPSRGWHQR